MAKALCLGLQGSGKSTFVLNARYVFGHKNSDEDNARVLSVLHKNARQAMRMLVAACESSNMVFRKSSKGHAKRASIDSKDPVEQDLANAMDKLWHDENVKRVFQRKQEFPLLPNTRYYIANIMRFVSPDAVPTTEDSLRILEPTTGVNTTSIEIPDSGTCILTDVGSGDRDADSEIQESAEQQVPVQTAIDAALSSHYDALIVFVDLLKQDSEAKLKPTLDLLQQVLAKQGSSSSSSSSTPASSSQTQKPVPVFVVYNKKDLFEERFELDDVAEEKMIISQKNYERSVLENIQKTFSSMLSKVLPPEQVRFYTVSSLKEEQVEEVMRAVVQAAKKGAHPSVSVKEEKERVKEKEEKAMSWWLIGVISAFVVAAAAAAAYAYTRPKRK